MNWTMEALFNNHENTKLTSNVKLVESHATVDRSFLPKLYAKVIMGHSQRHIQPLSQTANGAKTGDQIENYKNQPDDNINSDSSDDGTSRYSSNSRRSSLTGKEKKRGGLKNDSWSKAIPPHTAQIPPNSYEATTNSK
ncbi:unnamed protein product [Diamesa serratosioi]